MQINLGIVKFDVNGMWAILLIPLGIILFFTLGIYIIMLSLNYVFFMLHSWEIMSQVIIVTFWQTLLLVIAGFIIRYIFFKV
jgi:hypothetical protein